MDIPLNMLFYVYFIINGKKFIKSIKCKKKFDYIKKRGWMWAQSCYGYGGGQGEY